MPVRFLLGLVFWLLWGGAVQSTAAPLALSDGARVSLLTCAPGPEAYALFGHSALRITDPANGLDQVYNYGSFDFQTPHFYWRFLRGDLRYFLSATSFAAFQSAYRRDNRAISEQVLVLSSEEAQRIYHRLDTTLHSPARFYRYQFFADNCTTRLFELISTSLTSPLRVDSAYASPALTYRQLLGPYLAPAPWVRLGMNLGLGWPADQRTTFRQRLFLPQELAVALANSTRQQRPFVSSPRTVFVAPRLATDAVQVTPSTFLLVLLALFILAAQLPPRYGFIDRIMRSGVFIAVGLTGGVMLGLSCFSLHTPTHANYQLLWLPPTYVLLGFARPAPRWQTYTTVSLVLLIVGQLFSAVIYSGALLPEAASLFLLLLFQLLTFQRQCRGLEPTSFTG